MMDILLQSLTFHLEMNSIFEMFMESSYFGSFAKSGFTFNCLTLQETRSIHDSMNRSKIEFIFYIYILL